MNVNAFTAVDYENLLPFVRASTKACPEPIRLLQLQATVNDFCRRSRCWRQRNTLILTTVGGQDVYPVSISTAGVELVQLHSTWVNGDEIPLPQPGEGDDAAPGALTGSPPGQWDAGNDWNSTSTWNGESPTGWKVYVDSIEALSVAPIPGVGGQVVTGTVSFAPTIDALVLPSFVYAEWRNEIAAGAIAALCEQPGKPWSDPAVAQYERKCYEDAIMNAATKHGPIKRVPLRVKPSKV